MRKDIDFRHWDQADDAALRGMVALGARRCDIVAVTGFTTQSIGRVMRRLYLVCTNRRYPRSADGQRALHQRCQRLWRPSAPVVSPAALLRDENAARHRDWMARQRLVGPAPWEASDAR